MLQSRLNLSAILLLLLLIVTVLFIIIVLAWVFAQTGRGKVVFAGHVSTGHAGVPVEGGAGGGRAGEGALLVAFDHGDALVFVVRHVV